MALIDTKGTPHLTCGQCQAVVVWPGELGAKAKADIAEVARRDTVRAAQLVERQYGLDEREGRALVVHVTRASGICHRCESRVSHGETLCAKCHAANLDW